MKHTTTLLLAALLGGGSARALAQGNCPPLPTSQGHISQFTSVMPSTQPQDLRLPATHTFQLLVQGGAAYSTAADGSVI